MVPASPLLPPQSSQGSQLIKLVSSYSRSTARRATGSPGSYQPLANDLVLILKLNNDLFIYVKFITLYLRYKH